jgi:hypothetical protein
VKGDDQGSVVTISTVLRADMKYGQQTARLFAYSPGLLTLVPVRLNKQ